MPDDGDYLRHDGPEHVHCVAPTRSGKGVGLVVPTLLTWPGSAIVHDIKGENWQLTAGFRARHGRVLLFDPTNAASAAYNPLLEVRRGEWEVRDVQNAGILVDPEGSLEKRNHWEKTSHALLVGVILHVLCAEEDKTLARVAAFLSDPRRSIEATLAAMMKTPHLGEAGPHPVIASAARELLNKSENERSGVLSTAMSFLGLYRDPVVVQPHRQRLAHVQRVISHLRIVEVARPDDRLAFGKAMGREHGDQRVHALLVRSRDDRLKRGIAPRPVAHGEVEPWIEQFGIQPADEQGQDPVLKRARRGRGLNHAGCVGLLPHIQHGLCQRGTGAASECGPHRDDVWASCRAGRQLSELDHLELAAGNPEDPGMAMGREDHPVLEGFRFGPRESGRQDLHRADRAAGS